MSDGFTRSGNGKRHKSGARVRRILERADRDDWNTRRLRHCAQYGRYWKSFQNVKTHDKNGNTFWAMDRPALFHKGGKP